MMGEKIERVSFRVSGVDKRWFEEEFLPDCRENYNDTYILKILNDHDTSKTFMPRFERLLREIEELKVLIDDLKGELKNGKAK
jgi:hypothetical protein